jgi:hypothetical protein
MFVLIIAAAYLSWEQQCTTQFMAGVRVRILTIIAAGAPTLKPP